MQQNADKKEHHFTSYLFVTNKIELKISKVTEFKKNVDKAKAL